MQGQTSSYVLTTLVTAPKSAALTTLANVKDELSLTATDTSNDSTLQRWINEESAGIARYCNRIFGLAMWQDEFRPQRGVWGEGVRNANNPLKLARWPLCKAAAVVITGNTHGSVLIDGIASTVGIECGMLVAATDGSIPAGTIVQGVTPYSITLSQAATSSVTGQSVSVGINVIETKAGQSTWLKAGTDFEIDYGTLLPGDEGAGRIYRLNELGNPRTWHATTITVLYQTGYALPCTDDDDDDDDTSICTNVPGDLESACIRLVVARFRARGRDPRLVERSQGPGIGVERFWVGAAPGQRGPYPNEIMAVLDSYRQPVVGIA